MTTLLHSIAPLLRPLAPAWRWLRGFLGFRPAAELAGAGPDAQFDQRNRRFYSVSVGIHLALLGVSVLSWSGCMHEVPAGVPLGKGDKLTLGKVQLVRAPREVRRKKKVRQSPVSIFEMVTDDEAAQEKQVKAQFSDNVGVPGGIGEGASAAGSPQGTALGGKLYFYRVKYDGPDWNGNREGVRPLMNEVLRAGVVKKVSGFNNTVSLKDLPKHSGEFLPQMLYMTGTGPIKATDDEVKNLRDYLHAGGMLFADVSGGDFHDHFVSFMRRVFPDQNLAEIEFDNEIYRGAGMPYAILHGCPIYRRHRGAGPAMGIWIGPRLAVFYSRGDLGAGWGAAGIFTSRRRSVEQAFRMGVNLTAYSLLYYKYQGDG